MRTYLLFIFLCPLLIFAGQSTLHPPKETISFGTSDAIVKSNNEFGFSLHRSLSPDDNAFFSPLSIHSCLSMVYFGANGQTAQEMQRILHLINNLEETSSELSKLHKKMTQFTFQDSSYSFANGIWHEPSFFLNPEYQSFLSDRFDMSTYLAHFSLNPELEKNTINQWIEKHTQGHIKDLLSNQDITTDTRIVLANALYLKAAWQKPFTKIGKRHFTLENGETVEAESMRKKSHYEYLETEEMKTIFIPLANSSLGCLVIHPKDTAHLTTLEESLSHELIENNMFNSSRSNVQLTIPKFSLNHKINLKGTLMQMGMKKPFQSDADFSKMCINDLYLSDVIHQAKIDFDENGITAAAATAAVMNCCAFIPEEEKLIDFEVNSPFLFAVIDRETKTILFWGRVKNPI